MRMMITWAGPEALPGMVGLDHVGLAVPDLEAAVTLHTEGFGLRVEHRETNADQGVVEVMLTASFRGRTDDPAAAGRPPGRVLPGASVSQPARPRSAPPGVRSQRCANRIQRFLRRGLRLLYDAPRAGTRGSLINFVHPKDTGGVLIELVSTPPTTGARVERGLRSGMGAI